MRHASSCNPQWPVDSVASLGIQDQLNGIQRPTKWNSKTVALSCNPQWPVDSVAGLGIQDQSNGIQRPTKWNPKTVVFLAIHSDQSTLWPVLESKTNQMESKDQPNAIQRLCPVLQSTVASRLYILHATSCLAQTLRSQWPHYRLWCYAVSYTAVHMQALISTLPFL